LTIDIHVSGLNLAEGVITPDDQPIFTVDGYDVSDALVRSSNIDMVDPGTRLASPWTAAASITSG
jgi:hypothetical protein